MDLVLVWVSLLPASKVKVVLGSGKGGFSFWPQLCVRTRVGVFLSALMNIEELGPMVRCTLHKGGSTTTCKFP